jgi:hypothetical protein
MHFRFPSALRAMAFPLLNNLSNKGGPAMGKTEISSAEKSKKGEAPRAFEERHTCLICGKPGPETICEHCKIVVQAEALNEKRKVEKGGGGPK